MEELSSRQLIKRCVDGDLEAQSLVIDRYRTRLLTLARQGAARDQGRVQPDSIVAEVFLRFLQLAQSGRLEYQFEGGLWHLLSHMTALRLKEKRRDVANPRRTARGGSQAAVDRNAEEPGCLDDALDDFRKLLTEYRQQLAQERAAIFDGWLSGDSSLQIADRLGMSDRNVRRILAGFREDLSREMNRRLQT